MKKYSIVCMCQIYNEMRKGNLERFVKYIKPLVDALVVYDDGSTDGSYEYMLKQTPHVIRGVDNDFANEISHKQLLLEQALKLSPDFILWLDADEVLTANAAACLQEKCQVCIDNQIDALSFHELNLWRSHSWRRLDSLFDTGWFVRLWRVTPGMSYESKRPGLHQRQYPASIRAIRRDDDIKVLHYGFASKRNLAYKYLVYRSHEQRGYNRLDRLISEESLVLEKVPRELFPEGLWVDDERPHAMKFEDSLAYVEQFRAEVFKPKFSVICLVYKSVAWLKFVYEQVLKYTHLHDKEFFFVANDANDAVLQYLQNNYIPHYVFHNTPRQRQEWFINNVYRAYNFAAAKAQGDFLIFINSDMGFSPGWLEKLWAGYNGSNCVSSHLVESGKLRSGAHAVEKNFGRDCTSYQEEAFLAYAATLAQPAIKDGGLFMPLLICKEHFSAVGGYPEGNIVPGSDLFAPTIAVKGEACISGDNVLMQKLKTKGIVHQTAFDSMVYHFQCGEPDALESLVGDTNKIRIAVCNDLVTGTMGEKVLWDFLLETLPASTGIDTRLLGSKNNFASNARNYIEQKHPDLDVIIQNATFIDTIDPSRYTIAFLQDNLRAMGRSSKQQEQNLRLAGKLVTNSMQTALSYPEFDFEIIPIGVNSELFKPLDKERLRAEMGFGRERIGIFVGDFSEVKGWSQISRCIDFFPQITWILVSKKKETCNKPNVRVYNRISQNLLAQLLNCADFFIVGSPVETQCLAAIEACLCNIPVVMRNTGIFREFSETERSQAGIFGDDFIAAVKEMPNRSFSPRRVIMERKLTIQGSMEKWMNLVVKVVQEIRNGHLAAR